MILGLDEAGRGSVLGPLVICGLAVEEKYEKKLKKIGVKDSKELSRKKREALAPKIEKIARHTIILRVSPCKIDANRKRGINLNQIEAMSMAEIINMINPDKTYIDSPSYNNHKFEDFLRSKLDNKKVKLICENYADRKYPVVSAASIIAKVDRDQRIKELEEKVDQPVGVGYPHDEVTIKFLEELAEKNKGKMPTYVRTSWDTTQQIIKRYEQKGIFNFLERIIKK